MPQNNACFGVFPFSEPYLSRFDTIVRPIIETHTGLVYEDARHAYAPEILKIDWIRSKIDEAFLIVADISERSKPNVFIELGMAYFTRKRLVVLCDKNHFEAAEDAGGFGRRIPLDLEGKDVLLYGDNNELKVKLGQFIADAISETRPVKLDWMSHSERNHFKSASELELFSHDLFREEDYNEPRFDQAFNQSLIWSTMAISHNFTLSYRVGVIGWKQMATRFKNPDLRLFLCPKMVEHLGGTRFGDDLLRV